MSMLDLGDPLISWTKLANGMGVEAAGVVEAVGSGVSNVAVGDKVTYTGFLNTLGAYSTARLIQAALLIKRIIDAKMGAGFDLRVDSVKEGSLQSGTRQAVVVLACDFPVGGTAAAYLFDERSDTAVLLAQVGDANWGHGDG